jgi:polyvinyl alcohol dehydrogenase (cytochrome)
MSSNYKWRLRIIAAVSVLYAAMPVRAQTAQWVTAGHDLSNTRSQPEETTITPANVSKLTTKWVFTTGGDVSATPTVANGSVYFPDWAGNLYAVNAGTGKLVWSHQISDYDGFAGAFSRVSPTIDGGSLIIGDVEGHAQNHNGANVISLNASTGELQWITEVESHPAAVITGSPVVYNGVVYVGVSSLEETLAEDPTYVCCSFRGSVVALNERNGEILWKTYNVPDNGGSTDQYSGGAVWQPPVIDPLRGLLYIGTGNNYSSPAGVEACENADAAANCAASNDHFDSALALDLRNGHIKWANRLQGSDTWTIACLLSGAATNPNCPVASSQDFDLGGSGANFLGTMIGFGQKSGIYWALNPDNGQVLWATPVGPGGPVGGVEWGTATDGQRIYVAIANSDGLPYTLVSGQKITGGAWSALDVATGKILWQTADPTSGATDRSSVSVANGVVYAGSYAGEMYALAAATGKILWSFPSGGSVIDGPSIVDGTLYWGSGYKEVAPGTGNNKLYAFSLP